MNNELRFLIQSTQALCESMPCGGIGAKGPTQEELDEAIEQGAPITGDDTFHRGQQIWLNLDRMLQLLEDKRGKYDGRRDRRCDTGDGGTKESVAKI